MMNASQFMDKQIMDLSKSGSSKKDLVDLMDNPSSEREEEQKVNDGIRIKKEEIVPSYDFQPIRPFAPAGLKSDGSARVWKSSDSTPNLSTSPIKPRNYGLESGEPVEVTPEKDQSASNAAVISEIERLMKKHTDHLLHVLEGVGARLTQLESRARHLEDSVDDLKVSVENNYGSTDGKIRQLENMLREVQTGVQDLKDKQDVVEAQLQRAKIQVSKADEQSETKNTLPVNSMQQAASAPLQSLQLPPSNPAQPLPTLPPNAPPQLLSQQNMLPSAHLPSQFPQNQIPSVPQQDPYFQPPGKPQEQPPLQYQLPSVQPAHPAPSGPSHQQYQMPPQPQYSQPSQPPQQHPSLAPINSSQLQSPLGPQPEEKPYSPSPNYQPILRQPPSQPPSVPQQYFGATPAYEPQAGRSSSGYGPPSDPYSYGGLPSQYGSNSTMKPQQVPATAQGGGSGYPQFPSARGLPHALPAASGVGAESGSPSAGNRVPIDDVVDKVTSMGFPREHVRATVQRLTENGQSVDLNVVLDKLMNDGEVQPPRGWFGR